MLILIKSHKIYISRVFNFAKSINFAKISENMYPRKCLPYRHAGRQSDKLRGHTYITSRRSVLLNTDENKRTYVRHLVGDWKNTEKTNIIQTNISSSYYYF